MAGQVDWKARPTYAPAQNLIWWVEFPCCLDAHCTGAIKHQHAASDARAPLGLYHAESRAGPSN